MSEMVKYGSIWVLAGVMMSGAAWWMRTSQVWRAEDAAQVLAATRERWGYAYAMGDEPPLWTLSQYDGDWGADSNHVAYAVGNGPRWDQIYRYTLDRLRRMAADGYGHAADGIASPAWSARSVFWLDPRGPAPGHGDALVSVELSNGWYAAAAATSPAAPNTVTVCYTCAVSNHVEMVGVSASRLPPQAQTNWPGLPPRAAPLLAALGRDPAKGAAASADAWWRLIGNGATNYKYSCEQPIRTQIQRVWGSLMLLDGTSAVSSASIPVASSNDAAAFRVWVPAASSNDPAYRAGIFRAVRQGLEPQYVAVQRHGCSPGRSVNNSVPLRTLAEQQSGQIVFTPGGVPAASNRFSLAVGYNSGIALTWNAEEAWNWWVSGGPSLNRIILAASSNDTDRVNDVYGLTVDYLGQSHEFCGIQDDTAGAAAVRPLQASPQWIDAGVGGATQAVSITQQAESAANAPLTGRTVGVHNLREAWNSLTNMTRTVCVLPVSALVPGTNAQDNADHYDQRTIQHEAFTSTLYPDRNSTTNREFSSATNNPASGFGGRIAAASGGESYSFSQDNWVETPWTSPDLTMTEQSSSSRSRSWRRMQNCRLPYPAASALTSGVVAAVSVYAVVESSWGWSTAPPLPWSDGLSWTSWSQSVTPRMRPVGGPAGAPYGDGRIALCRTAGGDAVPACGWDLMDVYQPPAEPIRDVRLTLLSAVSAPDSADDLSFTLDGEPDWLDPDALPGYRYDSEGTSTETNHERATDITERYEDAVQVDVTAFVVVVDWSWDFCKKGGM
jgi:hypothetical protein